MKAKDQTEITIKSLTGKTYALSQPGDASAAKADRKLPGDLEWIESARPQSPDNWIALWQQLKPVHARALSDAVDIKIEIKQLIANRKITLSETEDKEFAKGEGSKFVFGAMPSGGGGDETESTSKGPAAQDKKSHEVSPQPVKQSSEDAAVESSTASKDGQPIEKTDTNGDPVSMITGEEMLLHEDAVLPGPMPFKWRRSYRSSRTADIGMGVAWAYSGHEYLLIEPDRIEYVDDQGRRIDFLLPESRSKAHHIAEGFTLERLSETAFALTKEGEWKRIFTRSSTRAPKAMLTQLRHAYYQPATRDKEESGFCIFLRHDASQRLVKIEGNWGKALQLSWQGKHVTEVRLCNLKKDKEKLVAAYHYDDQQNLVAHHNAAGIGEQYTYQNHLLVKRILPTGFSFYFEWDGEDHKAKCIHNWGDRGIYDYKFEWDDANKRSLTIDSRGFQSEYHYNTYGQVVLEVDNEGGVHRKNYEHGRLTEYTDPIGHATRYLYDKDNHAIGFLNSEGGSACASYFRGKQTAFTDRNGHTWRKRYNRKGQLVALTNPMGATTHYSYNLLGLVHEVRDAAGNTTQYRWNVQGECIAITDPRGHKRKFKYDAFGQVVEMTTLLDGDIEAGTTKYAYTATGKLAKVTAPNGDITTYSYNENDQLIKHSDPQGRITEFKYDGLSQVIERIDPEGQRLKYEYDTERNLTALINEKGERYTFEYDGNERLVKEVGFDGRTQQYAYNPAGHLISHTDAGELYTEFERDAEGRMLTKTISSLLDPNEPKEIVRYAYDGNGKLVETYNQHQYLEMRYNPLGQLQSEAHCDVKDLEKLLRSHTNIEYKYDRSGALTGIHLPDDQKIQYAYDDFGAWESIAFGNQQIAALQRDALGREVERRQGILHTQSEYDPSGRLAKQISFNAQHKLEGPVQRQYDYNEYGNLVALQDGPVETRYVYDFINRLTKTTGDQGETFAFDPAGNLLGNNSSAGSASGNRLTMQGDRKFEYDARGNLIKECRGKEGKLVTHYTYNLQNQLIKVEKQGQVTEYKYDPLGRRIEKRDTFGVTKYLWAGDQLVEERRQNIKKNYIYEPNSFKPVALIQDSKVYHYHLDHIGTPRELTNDAGEVVWKVRYRTYGNVAVKEVSEVENNLRFQGQYFDEETGLHYNRHRYYDPSVGQFTQQDPIGLLGGVNNYQYAPNPISWIDPLGLKCKEEVPGKAPAVKDPVKQRKAVAFEFYKSQGFAEEDIPSHLTGIDFDHPVEVVMIETGQPFYQFQSPGAPQGNYYADDINIKPTQLGISPMGTNRAKNRVEPKVKGVYIAQENTPALRSTAKPVDDFWSVKGESYPTEGGGTQYFTANKSAFKKSDKT